MSRSPVTAEQAVSAIASGDRVFVGGLACTPSALLSALTARAPELRDVSVMHLITMGDTPHIDPTCAGSFRTASFFLGPNTRDAVLANRADFIPVFLHELPRLLARRYPPDWALVQLSPPDRHGFCTVSLSADVVLAAVRTAKRVIAEINPQLPRTTGDTQIHVNALHAIVEVDHAPPELKPPTLTDAMRAIGRQIADMIVDGDCLQIGIGGIPNAVLELLGDRRHLGVHTEMLTDGIVSLYKSGAIDNSRKAIMPGKSVCAFAAGRSSLYDFVHDNPLFEFHGANFTNDPYVIAQNSNVVAVNSALQIDLTGQVDADSVGTHIYSGIGGQVDFIRGAARSEGGRPIIAIPSTAMGGTVSRIVPTLAPGAGVVTSRGDVHHVVTEFGHVDLFGLGVHARARALISIAHPNFREQLSREAHTLRLSWAESQN
jgi:4-hydroxybutyrate CoA-transferase